LSGYETCILCKYLILTVLIHHQYISTMQNRSFFSFLLLFNAIGAFAQSLIAEFPVAVPNAKIDNLLLAYGPDGSLGVCYTTPNDFVFRSLDKQGETLYQNTVALENDKLTPMGGVDLGDAFQFFYFKKKGNQFFAVKAHKTEDKKIEVIQLAPFHKYDISIANFVSDNECYTIAWDKPNHILKFGRYDKTTGRFDIKEKKMSDVLIEKLDKANISHISNTTLPEPSLAYSKYKIYRIPDGRIAITIEGSNYFVCQTEILLLDCENGNIAYSPIGKGIGKNPFVRPTSSFIYDGFIALTHSEKKSLDLDIIRLDSMKSVKEYHFTEDDSIYIMNSELMTESDNDMLLYNTKDVKKDNSKKVLKRLSGGEPFIYFEGLSDNEYLFTIGNYTRPNNGGGHTFGGMPGSSISTPYGMASIPGTPGIFVPYGSSYSLSKYFYSNLDSKTFEAKPGDASNSRFLSKIARDFVKDNIFARNTGLFRTEPEYQLLCLPHTTSALLVSYIRKDGVIKLHKIN
jgi:hypothetical protein